MVGAINGYRWITAKYSVRRRGKLL